MGDSWDETSFEVSEADLSKLNADSDDLDKDLFGSLGGAAGGARKPSLIQAMKQSTGKGMFEDNASKPAAKDVPKAQSIAKAAPKPVKKVVDDEDDLLADLLDDDDLTSTPRNIPAKPAPAKTTPAKAPLARNTPEKKDIFKKPEPVKQAAKVDTPKRTPQSKKPADNLFDDDDPLDLLGEPEPVKTPQSRTSTPQKSTSKSGNKFDNLLSKTSFFKEATDPGEDVEAFTPSTAPARATSTPIGRRGEPKPDSAGFTPSTSARENRSRAGLNSGYNPSTPDTPGSARGGTGGGRRARHDDTFANLLEEDKNDISDMFRVDKESASRPQTNTDIFRVDHKDPASRPQTSADRLQERPHTQAGGRTEVDGVVSSRPPSAGRRGGTPQKRAVSPPGTPASGPNMQRRPSVNSIFDEDEGPPASALPWELQVTTPQHGSPQGGTPNQGTPQQGTPRTTPLPWEQPAHTPQAAAAGPATTAILEQNKVLEKKIKELESETDQLKATVQSLEEEKKRGSEERGKEKGVLEGQVKGLREGVEELERRLERSEDALKRSELSVTESEKILERRLAQLNSQHKDEQRLTEQSHSDRINALNTLLEQKEQMIQNEMQSASKRLKEKEALILDEMKGERQGWEARLKEGERRHSEEYDRLVEAHAQTIEILNNDHSGEVQRQRELRQQELAAVLSVKKHTQSLTQLMEKVELSADEVANLSAKLEAGRSLTLEERERAANVMSEYLHDLQSKLSVQQKEVTSERERIQDVVGRMESHLRVQTRQSETIQSKLLVDEARLQSLQTRIEAEKLENERSLNREKECVDKAKAALVAEQKEMIEKFYTERKEIANERARISSVSQRATEEVARGAVKHLDIEAQAHAMLDHAKRELAQIELKREMWRKEEQGRLAQAESVKRQAEELEAEKERMMSATLRMERRSAEVEACSESFSNARSDCVKIQRQLAELETNLRMREDELAFKETNLREQQEATNAERELLHYDKQSLHEQGVKCPACKNYRPRSASKREKVHSPIRASSPLNNKLWKSPSRTVSPMNVMNTSALHASVLNASNESSGSGSNRYRYPSASVLELTGSLQRFNVINDSETIKVQSQRIEKLKENQCRLQENNQRLLTS